MDHEIFEAGDIALQSGRMLRNAKLAYKTYGKLNAKRDNAIVYPTWFASTHADNEWLIGPGKALDPSEYFIVVPNSFGNGVSSSPSNQPAPNDRGRFPNVTVYDNVVQQHRLVTEHLGIDTLRLVTGWSLGAVHAFHWAALYPDMVQRLLPFQGAARASRHFQVFFAGVKAALQADAEWREGFYERQPERGLRAAGRVYAGWGFSQKFLRDRLDIEALGFASLEDFLIEFWEGWLMSKDANNLVASLWTGQHGDIADNPVYRGDFVAALSAIKARAIVMPSSSDLYFPPEDSAFEVAHMPNAELRVLPSDWGHLAGKGLHEPDNAFIDNALRELLAA